jgi:serine/threonine-protein kinase HipA
MAKTLDVYLYRELVGHLVQDDGGQMVFDYAPSWLESPHAVPLSHSLPLRKDRFKRNECRGFFAGILPEENNRATDASRSLLRAFSQSWRGFLLSNPL